MRQAPASRLVFSALVGIASSVWPALVQPILGQHPTVSALSPLSVRPGQTQDVVIRGASLAGATQFWTSFPSQAGLTPQKPNNGKQPGEVSFRLAVPGETSPGIYGARIATAGGISSIKPLLVDDLPTVIQQPAGNTTPAAAQQVSLPTAIDGVIEPLARRYFKFHVESGQQISLEIFARRIGSPLDPILRLLDASGREITYCDDLPGLNEDAAIDYKFAKAGDYCVEVGDNLYQGGGDYVFHLRIGDFPSAVVALPPAAARGSQVTFQFASQLGASVEPAFVKVPSAPNLFAMNLPARKNGGAVRSFAPVLLSDRQEVSEIEPNDDSKSATRFEIGANLNGRLQSPGDVDLFVFHAKAGQRAHFASVSRPFGSPADVALRLLNRDGSQIEAAESTGSDEASLNGSFPSEADYLLEVRDLNRRGGPRYAYHIDVAPVIAGFTLAASADSLNIPAGGTAIVTIKADRHPGFGGPITVRAVDLPAGVKSVPTVIGPGQKNTVLSLQAAAAAPSGRIHPIRIVGSAQIEKTNYETSATVTEALKSALAALAYPPPTLSLATAVGIAPRPSFTLRTEPTQLVFGRGLSTTVKVIAERQKGFEEEISLEVVHENVPVPPGSPPKLVAILPEGITATNATIPKGATSAEIRFQANRNAQLSDFTVVLVGLAKKVNESQPAPGIGLKLDVPFRLTVSPASAKFSRTGTVRLKVAAQRNPAFRGEIALSLSRLPKGLSAAPAKLAAGASEGEIIISAAADAAPGAIKNLTVIGQARIGGNRYSARTPLGEIAVE